MDHQIPSTSKGTRATPPQPLHSRTRKISRKGMAYIPGDIILPARPPFLKVLYQSQRESRCTACFAPPRPALLRCAGCRIVLYCNKICQKTDWRNGHSLECRSDLFRFPMNHVDGQPLDPNLFFRVLRTTAYFHLHPKEATKPFRSIIDDSVPPRCFWDLRRVSEQDSEENQQQDKEDNVDDAVIGRHLEIVLRTDRGFQNCSEARADFLNRIAAIWSRNSFPIVDDGEAEQEGNQQGLSIGGGIYMEASFLDHSCRPNAVRVSSSGRDGSVMWGLEVRCISPIPLNTKPTISYLAGNRPYLPRKSVLQAKYNLNCTCPLCKEESSANGDLIDYALLESRKQDLYSVELWPWAQSMSTFEETLGLLRTLFNEYDERVTNYCISFFEGLAIRLRNKARDVPLLGFLRFVGDVAGRIRLTFGSEHVEYRRFIRGVRGLDWEDRGVGLCQVEDWLFGRVCGEGLRLRLRGDGGGGGGEEGVVGGKKMKQD